MIMRSRSTAQGWVFVLVMLACAASWAQAVPEPDFSSSQAIQQRLDVVHAELNGPDARFDPNVRESLLQLETDLYQHLEAVDYVAQMNHELKAAQEALSNWSGLALPPPYSIQFADDLRAQQQSLQHQLYTTESRQNIIYRVIDQTNNKLDEYQRATRQAQENADTAASTETKVVAEAAAQRGELGSRIMVEQLARLQLRRDSHTVQKLAIESALELVSLKVDAVRGKIEFKQSELDEIQTRIAAERSAVLAETTNDTEKRGKQGRQVTWKIDLLDIERDFWNEVFAALNTAAAPELRRRVAAIGALKERVDDWVQLIQLQAREAVEETSTGVGKLASQSDVRHIIKLQNQLEFVLLQLGDEGISGISLFENVRNALLSIWGIELYLAEETASVGGKKVSTYRAVTLGKLILLALIITIGWFVLRFLTHRIHALVAKRSNLESSTADTARRWTFGLGLSILLIYGLNRVHIPFTAFAFLGGTLAIGIGFGAQTLLKNFISGVILTFERPFRVGDLVEVEDIIGHIQRIGMRASVIQHFDGTDTLMPNSSLLENRVSNWTLDKFTSMRGEIEVGVTYGSNTREVSRVLQSVADSHGLVLKNPEPTVQFTAFGDNTLKFSLMFWFDATRTRIESISSDLRFMVDKSFAEAGIIIAFPQRDIHFDDSKPLRIELSRTRKESDAG